MLILTRRIGEKIYIFNEDNYKFIELEVILLSIKSNQISIGFEARQKYTILREEIYRQIAHEKWIDIPAPKLTKEEITAETKKRIEKRKNLEKTREYMRCLEA